MKKAKSVLVVLAVMLSGCYLFSPKDTSPVTSVTVEPAYLTVGPGEQVTVNVTTDPPNAGGSVSWSIKDDYYAAVYGTNQVGLITGKHLGSTTLTATIGGKSSDVLCNVVPAGAAGSGGYITSTDTVILMAPGDSRNVSAQLVGGSDQDQSGIQWQVKDSSVLDILGQGPNALLTALKNGTTQITLSHPMSTTTFTIAVRVDASTKALQLSKSSFIMTPGDIQELDAAIADGSLSDLSSITWSVRAGTGTDSNFLTITGSGGMINIIANSPGQGTIFAVFGSQTTQCDVIVQPGKKMAFQTGAVSGSPGDSLTVGYDYSPTTMNVSWTISDSSVASYSVDSSAKKVTITLLKEGTTSLRGTLSDGVTYDTLAITSKWDRSIVLSQTSLYGAPSDGPAVVNFIVSPPGTPVSVSSDNTAVATASVDNTLHTITITPHQEGQADISATTPDVSANIGCSYSYTALGVNVTYSFSGGHSQLSSGQILISTAHGSATITASPSMSGATGMSYTWNYQGSNNNGTLSYGTVSDNIFVFNNNSSTGTVGFIDIGVFAGISMQAGTLYLTVSHNGTNILSTSWPIYVTWN